MGLNFFDLHINAWPPHSLWLKLQGLIFLIFLLSVR